MIGSRLNARILWIGFLIVDVSLSKTTQLEVLKNLAKRGHEVDLLVTYSKNKTINQDSIDLSLIPLRYIPVLTPFFFAASILIFIPFYIAAKRPKYIIVQPDLTVLIFIWKPFLHALGIKIVLDIRSTPIEVVSFRRHLSALWFNVSVIVGKKAFDGMTTLTSRMKQQLCDDFHIEPDRIGVWTSGVSQEIYAPEKYDTSELRRELSWADRFVVMYHGRLTSYRGLIESIEAIKIAKQKCPNLLFFLLGSGPALESMKALVMKSSLEKSVEFHSPVPYERVPRFIAAADVGIVPLPNFDMWRNQSPLKLMEYLAMKKVTIITDIPMAREVIGENECGIYIKTASPTEISTAILYAYGNREKLTGWGNVGRKIVEERYSWTNVAQNLESYLLQL